MRLRHPLLPTVVALLLLLPMGAAGAAGAEAAAPGNDTPAGATVLAPLPTTVTQDTSGATSDELDAALNARCGAPGMHASVWFVVTDDESFEGVEILLLDSDRSVGFLVTQGPPAELDVLRCAPGHAVLPTEPGATYYVSAFHDLASPRPGGTLTFEARPLRSPDVALTVDRRGTAAPDGSAVVTGTYTCSVDVDAPSVVGSLTQRVGRSPATAGSFELRDLVCDGTAQTWRAAVPGDAGTFARGRAAVVATLTGCSVLCSRVVVDHRVWLQRERRG